MWYAIISEDVPNSLKRRLQVRENHLSRLQNLQDEGRLLLAGPHPMVDDQNQIEEGFSGSLIVASFDSLTSARSWANDDPYAKTGVYCKVTVKPFSKVFP